MFRTILKSLPLVALPVVVGAETNETPTWCCPDLCQQADQNAALLPRPDHSGHYDLLLNGTRVPVMPGAFHGTSSDRPMTYCIGYDAFGDRQVKCLIVPSIV